MNLKFYKYQGTGNDFVIIDNREGVFDPTNLKAVRHLCHRKFGIGSDGLILIQDHPELDFEMVFFNPDGSQSMCGNGSRCAVKFAIDMGIVPIGQTTSFLSTDGMHNAYWKDGLVYLSMRDVAANEIVSADDHYEINTGSPHFVKMVNELENMDVVQEGRKIRYHDTFKKEGINVNFVSRKSANHIAVRTYERGVEDETLSCGTGVTACAIAMHLIEGSKQVKIDSMGGQLQVCFEPANGLYQEIYLIGPAEKVFEGDIVLEV
jgi:diaminopimelate epimerase